MQLKRGNTSIYKIYKGSSLFFDVRDATATPDFIFYSPPTSNVNYDMSGSGSLYKYGPSNLDVYTNNLKFTGSINVNEGTLKINNLLANGGSDLISINPSIINLNNNSTLNLYSNVDVQNRISLIGKTINFNSNGSQTFNIERGNILLNNSVFNVSGGSKKYITNVGGFATYLNGQGSSITYNVNNGTDDVDLEVSAYLYNQIITKNGTGKMLISSQTTSNIQINSGTLVYSYPSNGQVHNIVNNSVLEYNSPEGNGWTYANITGTGSFIKSGVGLINFRSGIDSSGLITVQDGTIEKTISFIMQNSDTGLARCRFTKNNLDLYFNSIPAFQSIKIFNGPTSSIYETNITTNVSSYVFTYNSSTSTLTISND